MVQLVRVSLLTGLFYFIFALQASAKMPVFFQIGAEKVSKVQELPDKDFFLLENGTYMDLGVVYKQFTVFFIPLWNYDLQWCGYMGTDDQLITLNEESLKEVATEAGISIEGTPSLPFWPSIGGKLLFLAIIGGFIAYAVLSGDEEEEGLDEEGNVVPKFGTEVHQTTPLTEISPTTEEDPQEPKI